MPIKTGDLLEPIDSDGLVINAGLQADGNDGYNSYNPIRGLYHVNGNFSLLDNGGVDAPAYLHNNFAPPLNQMIRGALVTVKDNNVSNGPTTYYQALNGVDSDLVYNDGNPYSIFGQDVEDMAYNWQLRTNFHEFCMQYDKYPPIDSVHFNNYPEQYSFCVWRHDKREFQTVSPSFVMGQIVGDFVNRYQFRETLNADASSLAFDSNNDGEIGAADLLDFLAIFGEGVDVNLPSTAMVTFDDDIPVISGPDIHGHVNDDGLTLAQFNSFGRPSAVSDTSFFRWPNQPADITIDTSNNENLFGWSAFSVNKATTPAVEKDFIRFSGPSFQPQSDMTRRICKVSAIFEGSAVLEYTPVHVVLETKVHFSSGASRTYRSSNKPYVAPANVFSLPQPGSTFFDPLIFQTYDVNGVLLEDEILPMYEVTAAPYFEPSVGTNQTVMATMFAGSPKTVYGDYSGDVYYDDHFKYTLQYNDPAIAGYESSVYQVWPSEQVQHVDISVGICTHFSAADGTDPDGTFLNDVKLRGIRFEWLTPQLGTF